MKTVLAFGNPELKDDSLATEIAKELKIDGYEFVLCNNADELLFHINKDFCIMDVVKGIDDVTIIDDINALKNSNLVSLHDFDVAYFLKLLQKLNKIKKIRIIGLPQEGDKEQIKNKVIKILS